MKTEISTLLDSKQTMSSLEIANLTGKLHKDVLEAIRKMESAWVKVNGRNFSLVEYKDAKGEMRPCYELTKTECLYVATKFNDEARAKLVLRWEELEKKARAHMIALPDFTDPAEAAMAWAKEYNEKKALAIEN
jgi:phage regulator Rha-like protein